MQHDDPELEELNVKLNDPAVLSEFQAKYNTYHTGFLPRLLGRILIWCGNAVYGVRPSYLKFRAVEVIARVPYHSWESAAFTFLTMFYMNEGKAMKLSNLSWFSQMANDNETMHVVVISKLAHEEERANWFLHTLIPMLFAFFYFWAAYWLYLFSHKAAFELNYLFEKHAFEQYSEFLDKNEAALKTKPISSAYLTWYGRKPANQYEFFRSVRNDEIIHRNRSIDQIEKHKTNKHASS